MQSPVRGRLLWRLLSVQAAIVLGALAAAWLAIDYLASDSFMKLMKEFSIDPAEVEGMFHASTRTALLQVGAVALVIAFLASFWLTRKILRPLDHLATGAARIAAGDYDFRIATPRSPRDELDALTAEFNRMAEALATIERARRSMVVDVAHELRTPLTNLRGTVEAMQDGLMAGDAATLDALDEELLRLQRLVEDLLAVARAAGGSAPDRRIATDLRALIEGTLELFRPRLTRRGLSVDCQLGAFDTPVHVDPDQMRQVFGNLLENALHFAPRDSRIGVFGEQLDGRLRVTVENGGAPIPTAELGRIFEPYYRVDPSRSRSAGGAGLGLAIVRGLVEGHGGRVGAASDDRATRVWVDLPA